METPTNEFLDILGDMCRPAVKPEKEEECEGYESWPGATGGACMYCDKIESEH